NTQERYAFGWCRCAICVSAGQDRELPDPGIADAGARRSAGRTGVAVVSSRELDAQAVSVGAGGWAHEYLGLAVPPSVFGRAWLVMSLAELGKFAEAAKYEAEAIQLAEPTQHTHTIGWAYLAASILHLSNGDWGKARSLVENWIESGNVVMLLPWAVA